MPPTTVSAPRLRLDAALAAAALAVVALAIAGPSPLAVGLVWLAVVTPSLIAIDLAEHRLPNPIVLPGYAVVAATLALQLAVEPDAVRGMLLAALASGGLYLLLHLVGGLGLGDVKLAPLLGALAGAAGGEVAVLAIVLAFLTGGVAALWLLVRRGPGTALAFGPHMLAGAWTALALTA